MKQILLTTPVEKTIFIPWTQTHMKKIYIQRFYTYTFANLTSSKITVSRTMLTNEQHSDLTTTTKGDGINWSPLLIM